MVWAYRKALRTHVVRLLGPQTILCKAFGLLSLRVKGS